MEAAGPGPLGREAVALFPLIAKCGDSARFSRLWFHSLRKEESEGEEGSSRNLEPAEIRKARPMGEGIREYEVGSGAGAGWGRGQDTGDGTALQ